jgi:dipeptidyl aminopeptidase/acylaminoacyl peptidase
MSQDADARRGMIPEDIGALRQAGEPRVSPDGTTVAFTVADPDVAANRYARRIWLAAAGGGAGASGAGASDTGASGAARPFTGPGAEFLPRWSPDGRVLAFAATDADGGHPQVCTLPVSGGERLVVCAPGAAPTELAWSPDGTMLAFVARDPDPAQYGADGKQREKDMPPRRISRLLYRYNGTGWTADRPSRVFVVPADGSAPPRAVTPGPFEASGLAWSPDSAAIAFASGRHEAWDLDLATDLWTVPADGSRDPEAVTGGGRGWSHPAWSPDGSALAAYLNPTPLESPRHRQVAVIDLASGKDQVLTAALDRTCAPFGTMIAPAWAGDRVLFGVEDGGNVHLYLVDADGTGAPELVAGGDRWITEWDWAGGTLAFVAATPVSMGELVARDLDPARPAGAAAESGPAASGPAARGGAAERTLTSVTAALTAQVALAAPQRFTATSEGGAEVECWVIPPAGAVPGTRYPTLLNVHGGPFTQYGNRLVDDFQLQAAAGFAVLYCNPRGSSGYAEQWGRAIRGPQAQSDPGTGWGAVDFADVMACVDAACAQFDFIDPGKLGILGGSYGGFMTSWAIGHTGRFRAACSERACNNLLTMEHSADIAGFIRSYVGTDHLTDPGSYLALSPVTYAADMTTPVLILHSEDDLRCPVSQAEELFVALRRLGRDPVMYRFPAENHELTRAGAPRHRIMRAGLVLDWFRQHLADGAAAAGG